MPRRLQLALCMIPVFLLATEHDVAVGQELPTVVEGIVFDDPDGDGLQSRDEGALAGIRIAVLDGESGKPLMTSAGSVVETRSDSRGRYRYQATGHLDLRFRPFDPGLRTGTNPQGWLPTNPPERRVRAPNGAVVSDAHFGYRPRGMTAVEGIVFDDRDGDGRQDRGEAPLPGIRIVVLDGPSGSPLRTPAGAMVEVRTDAGGRYRYERQGALDLRLRPFDPGTRTSREPFGDIETNPVERRIRVADGESVTDAHFGHQPARRTAAEGAVFDDRNGNRRRDSNEPGFSGIRIAVLDGPSGNPLMTPAGAMVETRTDEQGRFRYETIGSMDLRFRPFDPGIATGSNSRGWLSTVPTERRIQAANGSVASNVDFAY